MARIPGEFVPLDVNYLRDRAIRAAGPDAELLYIRGLAHAKGGRTRGFIADFDLEVVAIGLRNVTKRVASLVRNGLWIETEGGWLIRSWDKWNVSPEESAAERKAKREGAIMGNHLRWHQDTPSPDCPICRRDTESHTESDEGSDMRSDDRSLERSKRREEKRREEKRTTSEVADAPVRPEITHLLDLLDKHIVANGSKAPQRTQRNIDAARLLLDKDGRTVEQIEAAIVWCQSDEFWRANVLSMAKLREKYDQLRLAAQRQTRPRSGDRAGDILRATEQRYAAATHLPQIGA